MEVAQVSRGNAMQVTLYILAGWFGLGALGGLTLLGTSIVFRRSELPIALHIAEAQHRQPSAGDVPEPVRSAILESTHR
jgi:hypothetical protein